MITFNDFQQLDLRIGKVKAVTEHPRADTLLILTVDIGGEERQMVAGLKGHYAAESLVGKNIVVLANLEPAVLRGVESQAMLLAAEEAGRVILLVPDQECAAGAKVR